MDTSSSATSRRQVLVSGLSAVAAAAMPGSHPRAASPRRIYSFRP